MAYKTGGIPYGPNEKHGPTLGRLDEDGLWYPGSEGTGGGGPSIYGVNIYGEGYPTRDKSSNPLPTFKKPELRELPTFTANRWNESEIDSIAQKRAAPGLREARDLTRRAMNKQYGSTNVTRMQLREALGGMGSAIDKVVGSASEAAAGEYAQKYARVNANKFNEYQSVAARDKEYNEKETEAAKLDYTGKMHGYDTENDFGKIDFQGKTSLANQQRMFVFQKAWDEYLKDKNTAT